MGEAGDCHPEGDGSAASRVDVGCRWQFRESRRGRADFSELSLSGSTVSFGSSRDSQESPTVPEPIVREHSFMEGAEDMALEALLGLPCRTRRRARN